MMTSVACSAPKLRSLLDAIAPEPEDSLLRLIGMHARDPRPDKIDLGVGVFRDERGHTPVLKAVKAAEADLVENEPSKSYLGARGDIGFVELLTPLIFGDRAVSSGIVRGLQTPGGTGALRLACDLIARGNPQARVWMGFLLVGPRRTLVSGKHRAQASRRIMMQRA